MKIAIKDLPYVGIVLALAIFVFPSFGIPSIAVCVYALIVTIVFCAFPLVYILEKGID